MLQVLKEFLLIINTEVQVQFVVTLHPLKWFNLLLVRLLETKNKDISQIYLM